MRDAPTGSRETRHGPHPFGRAARYPVDVKREVVVITGGSAGVGRATARAFAKDGAAIGLIARGRERLDATVAEIEHLGGKAVAISADVADAKQVDDAASTLE